MGIKAKFNLVMLLAFAAGLALAAAASRSLVMQNARQQVQEQAALLLAEASATRDYTATEIAPLLAEQAKLRFPPQSIPFWAAQRNFRDVAQSFPDYSYKEAALNPTNPADRATDWEADIIENFKQHPQLSEYSGVRQTPSGPVLTVARPVRVDDPSCLTCHSVPSAAPASMIDLYGRDNGFGWKLHSVQGAQIISVPMQVVLDRANRIFFVFVGGLAVIFAVMLLLMNVLLDLVIVRPIRTIAATATEISLGNMQAADIPVRGGDEVAKLAEAFNRMRRSLASAMQMLNT